jgi:hypothetical protein
MRRARRVLVWTAAGLLVGLVGAALVIGPSLRRVARIGAGVAAKQLCSCVFVAGRDEAGCRSDLPPGTDPVRVVVDHAGRTVRAWVPLLADRMAGYRDGTGCTLR